jgi:hypothetical protein
MANERRMSETQEMMMRENELRKKEEAQLNALANDAAVLQVRPS